MPKQAAMEAVGALNLEVLPFDSMEASHSADFVHRGISLGDRACLGTAQLRGFRVITAESGGPFVSETAGRIAIDSAASYREDAM